MTEGDGWDRGYAAGFEAAKEAAAHAIAVKHDATKNDPSAKNALFDARKIVLSLKAD